MTSRLPLDVDQWTDELKTIGVSQGGFAVNDKGTLFDHTRVADAREIAALPPIADAVGGEIALFAPLGRGGMGEVLLGRQTSLERDVAVKRPVLGHVADAGPELVKEARVAGALEHPNIIPVHLLGKGPDGAPLLVMKRIEGRSWRSLLASGVDLARDLPILMDVCRALHFAHSRGVVHRDVKPENVMVGNFGDVYLFDWGLAVGLDGASITGLPEAKTSRRIVGTPQYMAPEMAWPGARLDARTDVFLAGAVLLELLRGTPPNNAPDTWQALRDAYVCEEPAIPESVPEELAAICRHALRRNPDERPSSADELRAALERFRERAVARALIVEAGARLEALRGMPLGADSSAVLATYNECRFGFESALAIWPEAHVAVDGIESSIVAMVEREVATGRVDSAALLLGEARDPPGHLKESVGRLLREREREARSVGLLAHISHQTDPKVAQADRERLLMLTALSYLAFAAGAWLVDARGVARMHTVWFAAYSMVGVLGIGAAARFRPAIMSTRVSRSQFVALWLGMVGSAMMFTVATLTGLDLPATFTMGGVVLATSTAAASAWDPRVWPAVIPAAAAAVIPLQWPGAALLANAVGTALSLVLASLWRPPFMRPVASDAQEPTGAPPRSPT